MAQLVDSDPERSRDLQATRENIQFFADHMETLKEEYGGHYVVVHDEDVVAVAEQSESAWEQVSETEIDANQCVMQYVPEPGQAFFF